MKFVRHLIFFWLYLFCTTASGQTAHAPLLKGDRAYDLEKYKEAEKHYRKAADKEIGNPQAVFNLGNALYQQGNIEDAAQRYQQAANNAKTSTLRADALHNLGDAFLKQQRYKDAVRAYEESLRIRPADPDTKQNLQMAKKRLQEAEKKEKEQQQQKDQQGQEQKQDSNQSSQQKPQDQNDKQQNQPQQNEQTQPQKPQNEQQKKMEAQRLKKEDAKRLLETAVGADDRKNAKKYRSAQQKSRPKDSKKDW
ncbi:MAG: tetratricopeptide repeat protein [Saprospiraceae bacterium]